MSSSLVPEATTTNPVVVGSNDIFARVYIEHIGKIFVNFIYEEEYEEDKISTNKNILDNNNVSETMAPISSPFPRQQQQIQWRSVETIFSQELTSNIMEKYSSIAFMKKNMKKTKYLRKKIY